MPGEVKEKKQICLMGTPQVKKRGRPDDAPQPISDDAEAMQLLALLILAQSFLPEEGIREGNGAIRREWLLTRLHPEMIAAEPQRARDKMAYALGKLKAHLQIRAGAGDRARERNVIRVTLDHLSIDTQEIMAAAEHLYVPASQDKVIALADRPLLDGMAYPWLQEPMFQEVRALLDGHFLTALARKADSLVVRMETANALGKLEDASACRSEAVALLDKAARRLPGAPHPLALHFADLRTRAAHLPPTSAAHNVPRPATSFIGRETERAKIKARLTTDRLVTLTGMGGCGKTRLALQVAADLLDTGWSDVWLVELAGLSDPALVPQAAAAVLGVTEKPDQTLMQALIVRFRQKPALLLLDNCEHLLDACVDFAETLIQSCPELKILATSRQRLNIDGECLYRVPTLDTPTAKEFTAKELGANQVAALLSYEAVRLFLDRVRSHRDFILTASQVAPIAVICERLDGIPLALELAAARVRMLTVGQVAALLADRFAFLTEGRSRALSRHRTLRAVFDWSYEPLPEPEKALFCHLSLFAGGWTLDAAQSVGASEDVPAADILDLLTSLADKSLVAVSVTETSVRYYLLETVRQYAHDRLHERGAGDEAHRSHRAYYLRLAEEAEPELRGPNPKPWLDRLETEIGNLRAALGWRTDEDALRLACALQRFWQVRGYLQEGRQWLEREAGEGISEAARAGALIGAGALANLQGHFAQARRLHEAGLALYSQLGDRRGVAAALCEIGTTAVFQGDYAEAEEKYGESHRLFSKLQDKSGLSDALNGLGRYAHNKKQYPQAREKYEGSLTLRREGGDILKIAEVLTSLGRMNTYQGEHQEARALLEEGLALQSQVGHTQQIAMTLTSLGDLARAQGNDAEARTFLEPSLALMQRLGDRWGIAMALSTLAMVDYEQGELENARKRFEQTLASFQELGNERAVAGVLVNLACVARSQGKLDQSRSLFQKTLVKIWALQERSWAAATLEELGLLAAEQGQNGRALMLLGAAKSFMEETKYLLTPHECARSEQAASDARKALGEAAYASAWAEGRAMGWEQAIAYALTEP